MSRARTVTAAAIAACALAIGAAGCAYRPSAQPPAIQAATAYVPLPVSADITAAYLVIRNNGPRDSLVSASTSVGGRVTFRVATDDGNRVRSVPAIALPTDYTLRLVPDGPFLVITGARRMQNGEAITLTLNFARGDPVVVTAVVTNPQVGEPNYFMN
jgi:periplasmic copper chaperone A